MAPQPNNDPQEEEGPFRDVTNEFPEDLHEEEDRFRDITDELPEDEDELEYRDVSDPGAYTKHKTQMKLLRTPYNELDLQGGFKLRSGRDRK